MITVEQLIALLNDLPVDALKKPIFIDGPIMRDLVIESITMSCEDETVVGYVITQDNQQKEIEVNE